MGMTVFYCTLDSCLHRNDEEEQCLPSSSRNDRKECYESLTPMYSSFLYKQESVIPAKLVPVKLVLAKAGNG